MAVCRELRLESGPQPYHLSCWLPGEVIDKPKDRAIILLHGLSRDGVLEEMAKGGMTTRGKLATRWRFVAPRDEVEIARHDSVSQLRYKLVMRNEPAFRDVEKLLKQAGYSLACVSGSHHIFPKPGRQAENLLLRLARRCRVWSPF